jgi:hypothetical protein
VQCKLNMTRYSGTQKNLLCAHMWYCCPAAAAVMHTTPATVQTSHVHAQHMSPASTRTTPNTQHALLYMISESCTHKLSATTGHKHKKRQTKRHSCSCSTAFLGHLQGGQHPPLLFCMHLWSTRKAANSSGGQPDTYRCMCPRENAIYAWHTLTTLHPSLLTNHWYPNDRS